MPSDASLPPNAPTTLTETSPASSATYPANTNVKTAATPNGADFGAHGDPATQKNKTGPAVDGEADASVSNDNSKSDHAYQDPDTQLPHGSGPDPTTQDEIPYVPPNTIPLSKVCADVHRRLVGFLDADPGGDPGHDAQTVRQTQVRVRESLAVIEQALVDYGFEHLSLSYNGGKDCLVLLLLYLAVLHTHFTTPPASRTPTATTFPSSIPSIYATPPDPFDAVTSFVARSSAQYHLDLEHIRTNPPPPPPPPTDPSTTPSSHPQSPSAQQQTLTFRDAFALYLKRHANLPITAIFVGTRRTDPHGARLTPFTPTDGNWPRFMRVHPVLDWHLREIWCLLRHPAMRDRNGHDLEYCAMYDAGYTSLGGRGDTVRNPKLRVVEMGRDGVEKVVYRPAYMMVEDRAERAGRE
jgi:FAD synthetase